MPNVRPGAWTRRLAAVVPPRIRSRLSAGLRSLKDGPYAAHPLNIERAVRRPTLLTEKIFFLLAHDRNPLRVTFADKLAVRAFVEHRAGAQYLTALHRVASSPDDIDWLNLPSAYAAKITHGSGGNVIVSPHADPAAELPRDVDSARWGTFAVRPEQLDPSRASALFRDWLSRDYSTVHSETYPEWCYAPVPRRIFIEEYLDGGEGVSPADVKFFMLNGRCAFIQVVSDRFGHRTRDLMTPDWRWLRARLDRHRGTKPPPLPSRLPELLDVATRLAAGIDFVRVDLYQIADRVVFGEMTNYPEAGRSRFRPTSFDRRMGRRLQLSSARTTTT